MKLTQKETIDPSRFRQQQDIYVVKWRRDL